MSQSQIFEYKIHTDSHVVSLSGQTLVADYHHLVLMQQSKNIITVILISYMTLNGNRMRDM